MGFFETWALHLWLFFHFNLKYPNLYLYLPTGILGFRCNTYTRTYFYQLEFWGITCTCIYFYQLGFWGLIIIFVFNTNIIIILLFLHFTFLCLLLGNNNKLCAILDFMCVLNTWCSKNFGYGFLHTKLILKQKI
jgi:hypothetical protein